MIANTQILRLIGSLVAVDVIIVPREVVVVADLLHGARPVIEGYHRVVSGSIVRVSHILVVLLTAGTVDAILWQVDLRAVCRWHLGVLWVVRGRALRDGGGHEVVLGLLK